MEGEVRIYGQIANSEGELIQGAEVTVKSNNFQAVAKGKSNDLGQYELFIQVGQYVGLHVKAPENGEKYLPYWQWNFSPMEDMEINVTLGEVEVFAMSAFIPQGTYPQYMIYFRPVCLSKMRLYNAGTKIGKGEILPLSPDLTIDDIKVTINEQVAKIFTLSKVKEYGGEFLLDGYFITTQRPLKMSFDEYTKITIKVTDKVSGDSGEGLLYW